MNETKAPTQTYEMWVAVPAIHVVVEASSEEEARSLGMAAAEESLFNVVKHWPCEGDVEGLALYTE